MNEEIQELNPILKRLLKPLIRIFLRNTKTFQEFVQLARAAFVEVAREEIESRNDEATVSKISIMSGVNRNDINKIIKAGPNPVPQQYNFLSRLLGQWQNDPRFCQRTGKARPLS